MLCLLFEVAGCKYAVDVRRVAEVVPRVLTRPLPQSPSYVAGLFDHGGLIVPVVDLGMLFHGEPCRSLMSTRIVLVECPLGAGKSRRLGMIAEQVNDVRQIDGESDDDLANRPDEAPSLGRIHQVERDLVQMVRVGSLLPSAVRDHLFGVVLEVA
jgi:chemotaxis-related protein WspB